MGIALFLDDRRDPPAGGDWTLVRTSSAAIKILATREVTYLSLDYDLEGEDCGALVVEWLAETIAADLSFPLPIWRIHSHNSKGAAELRSMLNAIERRISGR